MVYKLTCSMHIVAHCVSSDLCSGIIRCSFYYTICAHSVCGLLPFMARHSCGSRSRSRSVKGEGKHRTKGKDKGKGGTRSRSRLAKGGGKQRTTGKGKGKDAEPRDVPWLRDLQDCDLFMNTELSPTGEFQLPSYPGSPRSDRSHLTD